MEFSIPCGENIKLSDNSSLAQWNILFSGGVVFSEHALKENDVMNIDLNGSGRVEIGYSLIDPTSIIDFRQGIESAKIMNEIRVHKKKCEIKIWREHKKIKFSYNDTKQDKTVSARSNIWIVLHLKFGNVEATLGQTDARHCKFHPNCGTNVEFVERHPQRVKLRKENPACVCSLSRKLYPGQDVDFLIDPLKDGDRTPSRYRLLLGVTGLDPTSLYECDPESFLVTKYSERPTSSWKVIESFEKNECDGNLSVGIQEDGRLTFVHSKGKNDNISLTGMDTSSGILIVLEIWRVCVKIIESPECKSYECPVNVTDCFHNDPINASDHVPIDRRESDAYLEFRPVSPKINMDTPDGKFAPNRKSFSALLESVGKSVTSGKSMEEIDGCLESIKQDMEHEYINHSVVMQQDLNNLDPQSFDGYVEPISRDSNTSHQSVSARHEGLAAEKYEELCMRISEIEKAIRKLQSNQPKLNKVMKTIDDLKIVVKTAANTEQKERDINIGQSVRCNYVDITNNLELFPFCDHLYQGDYLTEYEFNRIREIRDSDCYEAKKYLLRIVSKRNIQAKLLKEACLATKQQGILNLLLNNAKD